MPLAAVVSKTDWENLSDEVKSFYSAKESGYEDLLFLNVERSEIVNPKTKSKEVYAVENVTGLKTALQSERQQRQDLEAALKGYEGLNAQQAREALKKLEELGDNPNTSKAMEAQIEAIKKQLTEKAEAEKAPLIKERDNYAAQISNLLVDQKALNALSKHKLVEGGVALIMPHIRQSLRVVKDNSGNFVTKVFDQNGAERISLKENNTEPMTVEEFIDDMSTQPGYKVAFLGSGASGGDGSPPADKDKPRQRAPEHYDNPDDDPRSRVHGIHRKFERPEQNLMDLRARQGGG